MIVPGGKAGPVTVDKDEHLRPDTTAEGLAKLKPFARTPGTITAGNASGVNDGAAAMIIASDAAAKKHGLTPYARIIGALQTSIVMICLGAAFLFLRGRITGSEEGFLVFGILTAENELPDVRLGS